jgi:hypothetical protein
MTNTYLKSEKGASIERQQFDGMFVPQQYYFVRLIFLRGIFML